MYRVRSKWQNYVDRKRVIKLTRLCELLPGAMGMNLNDFLKLTKSMCHSVNHVKSPLYKNEQRLPSDGKPSVRIWQIFYEPGQIANLDLEFEPYDWLCNPHPEYT
ncbi:MAG: hypothetical protein WB554_12355, partial [Desulfomonilaceae bacterium]